MNVSWWLSAKVRALVATPEDLQGLVHLAKPLPELQGLRQAPKALKNGPGTPKNGASPAPLFHFTDGSAVVPS